MIGLQLFVTTSNVTPAGPSAAKFYAFVNQQNFAVEFTEADVGKTAYYYGRGRVGPWSVLTGVVVA